jgi:hypothetical protein
MTSLGGEQERFGYMLGKLLVWANEQGYLTRIGDVFAKTGHKENSNHYLKLAADILVYKQGAKEQNMDAHKAMHNYWDSIGGAPRIEKDLNHYALMYQGRY